MRLLGISVSALCFRQGPDDSRQQLGESNDEFEDNKPEKSNLCYDWFGKVREAIEILL